MDNMNSILRQLPKIDRLAADEKFCGLSENLIKTSARKVLDSLREAVSAGKTADTDYETITDTILTEYNKLKKGTLYRVINATGVPIHTNLGRAPLPYDVFMGAAETVCGYSNLEYSTESGKRGDRYHHASEYLKLLTGAEDAVIVNNNASAVFLILNTFCKNRETIVSRGELVEIGGSFRIPDVMKGSGSRLVEVGTTNKTRKSDYTEAVTAKTAMMMKIHKSNYEIVGFTGETSGAEVAEAARESGVLSYYDAGSGLLVKQVADSICADHTIPQLFSEGFDLISFSGDKMLGGCQAGIIAGKKKLIDKIKKNQLMRMLRVDKITLAVLQQVFLKYLTQQESTLPVNAMLKAENLREKALKLAEMIDAPTEVIPLKSTIGGGSCPLSEMDSWGVALVSDRKPQQTEKVLRSFEVPVIARIADDRVVLDVRTIDEKDFETVKKAAERIK